MVADTIFSVNPSNSRLNSGLGVCLFTYFTTALLTAGFFLYLRGLRSVGRRLVYLAIYIYIYLFFIFELTYF
nr:hypothetical protein [Cressdnaviricota sp.]